MKTKQIIAALAALVLLASCGKHKESDCNPYRGRYTPLTVVPGLELGMPLGEALKCPLLDTSGMEHVYGELCHEVELAGTFANDIPVRYSLRIDSLDALQSLKVDPLFRPIDTAEAMRILRSIASYNTENYGNPVHKSGDLFKSGRNIVYVWTVCGGISALVQSALSYHPDSVTRWITFGLFR